MAIDSITKTYHDGIIFLEQFLGKQGFQAAWSVILGIVGNEHDIFHPCFPKVHSGRRGMTSTDLPPLYLADVLQVGVGNV